MISVQKNIMRVIKMLLTDKSEMELNELLLDFHTKDGNCLTLTNTYCVSLPENCKYYEKCEKKKDNYWRKKDIHDCKYCINDECYNEFIWMYTAIDYLQYVVEGKDELKKAIAKVET